MEVALFWNFVLYLFYILNLHCVGYNICVMYGSCLGGRFSMKSVGISSSQQMCYKTMKLTFPINPNVSETGRVIRSGGCW